MKTTFSVSMFAFLLLFVALWWLAMRVRRLEWRLEEFYIDIEDASRTR